MQSLETSCLNCDAPLTGEYCASCGQKRPHRDLTLREFLRETTHELTQWEGKVPQTLKALLFRPGLLTRDFLEGRRNRWLSPLRVYLICSVAFFVGKPLVESITGRSAREAVQVSFATGPDGQMSPEDRRTIEEGLPARLFGKERVLRAVSNDEALNETIDTGFPKAMFIVLPWFAFLTKLAWRRRGWRYPSHLYAALHLHAAWFAVLTIATIVGGFIPALAGVAGVGFVAYMIWYAATAFKRLFGDSWKRTIAKAAVLGVVYMLSIFVTTLGILAYALFTI